MRILLVDDDDIATDMVAHALTRFGHEVVTARNGREALEFMRSGLYRLVILDWEMPDMSGIDVCWHIRTRYAASYVYVILLTMRRGTNNIVEGLDAGADDYISKPFAPEELAVRVRTGERLLSLISHEVTIFSLAKLTESRDRETGVHLERMREYCRVIASHLSGHKRFCEQVDGDYVRLLYMTSPLHDIGKVGIPDGILLKPGPLTAAEFDVMKQHTIIGSKTLEAAHAAYPDAKFLCMARDIARSHHEWFDGTGYPDGLVADEIPLCGQIVGLADVYDALTNKRIYKPAFTHERARQIILEEAGSHFDPDLVQAFIETEDRFVDIHERMAEPDREGALSVFESQIELALTNEQASTCSPAAL